MADLIPNPTAAIDALIASGPGGELRLADVNKRVETMRSIKTTSGTEIVLDGDLLARSITWSAS